MFTKIHPLYIICETPLHAGSGNALSFVDLPIQRERHTSFPKIEGSTLKGAFRQALETKVNSRAFEDYHNDDVKIHRVFGFDDGSLENDDLERLKGHFIDGHGDSATEFAGCIGFTDARLLLFPIKSLTGVFAWITCPRALMQLERDLKLYDSSFSIDGINLSIKEDEALLLSKQSSLKVSNKIILEEYAFTAKDASVKVGDQEFGDWLANTLFSDEVTKYWKEKVQKDLVILSNTDFADFVNLSTEVITRTKIDNNSGTVEQGALFTEEYLPAESVMYTMVMAHNEFRKKRKDGGSNDKLSDTEVLDFFTTLPEVLQLGGNATLGKGILRTVFKYKDNG